MQDKCRAGNPFIVMSGAPSRCIWNDWGRVTAFQVSSGSAGHTRSRKQALAMSVPIRAMKGPVGPVRIRRVKAWDTVTWLRKGWADLWDNPAASLPYGIYLAAAGFLIMAEIDVMPHLATAAILGFFFFGPLAAAGLYDISRARAEGQRIGLLTSLIGCDRHFDSLALYGLFLAIIVLAWERISAALFALQVQDDVPS